VGVLPELKIYSAAAKGSAVIDPESLPQDKLKAGLEALGFPVSTCWQVFPPTSSAPSLSLPAEEKIGAMLSCNVIVQQRAEVAQQVQAKLKKVFANL